MAEGRLTDGPSRRLKCGCGSSEFTKRHHVLSRHGGGTSEEPAGTYCAGCGERVDIRHLLDRLELEHKRAELKTLQEQIGRE
jgi:hypothetical protein